MIKIDAGNSSGSRNSTSSASVGPRATIRSAHPWGSAPRIGMRSPWPGLQTVKPWSR